MREKSFLPLSLEGARGFHKGWTVPLPKIAYVLLWFPKPSETFIFREVLNLWAMGLPLKVFTLYGVLYRHLSPEMALVAPQVKRLGIPGIKRFPRDIKYWWNRKASVVRWLLRTIPLRRWRSLEVGGENLWAFLCGFTLARYFEKEGIEHIHAPWANGPATAAWVASKLSGIPFSFTGRAIDVCPPDGALKEKICDSLFVRANSQDKVNYLRAFAGQRIDKIFLTYNGVPLEKHQLSPVLMQTPYKFLALGRFARFKGFDILLRAARILIDMGIDFHLTIAGSGPRSPQLKLLYKRLGLGRRVSFPGFIPYDKVSKLYSESDVFVMPSIIHTSGESDGVPNVIMEALLHRLPVVATDVAGISEVIHHGVTGYLVPQRDASALALALVKMTRDRQAALEMAEKGRALVQELFDPPRCHRRVYDIFMEFCRQKNTDGIR